MDDDAPNRFDVVVYPRWCKKCGICLEICPKSALGQDEFGTAYLKVPEACIGCELCAMICPELAIEVLKLGGKNEKEKE